ncbi:gluconate 2-dehydrogenase subunit 3 family protein [Novosphingobium sp.]|uniref:gluconate 2-dehydrogenase subunit 3 family protein n=1 Tax=Novosphingobium sp. TaxID=1874826 RepID=UPI0026349249|nr:gluconate 2-dehydrogenase subunit 3 family protein [Novosphingobium sp.]
MSRTPDLTETDRRGAMRLAAITAVGGATGLGPIGSAHAAEIRGYGKDPDLLKPARYWPPTLTTQEREGLALLADLLLPAQANLAAPSALGFADFIDEWMSAPYPAQQNDARRFRALLAALGSEVGQSGWLGADPVVRAQALLRIEQREPANEALNDLRKLVVGAVYTTPEGMAAIGYRGNEALESFAGPPDEVLARFAAELAKLTSA